ncbi:ABC transporter permease [Herbiconiux sp. CPCC 205716]|uniref:ABC transporter permease n=1 Tax=Herbiconiux gentiana TaxID=2970912 RepID=A0ABT2GA99_9MICO|nr:ABC transporter permease [Herbiconiux gentiana]MCS5713129.1 ABC transporter permease [Herbiconiux gentiana]
MRLGLLRDIGGEALASVGARPGRLLLGILGTLVGIGALVMTTGLGQTASGQLASRFDEVAATHAEVEPATASGADGTERAVATLPDDSLARVSGLAGVTAAALLAPIDLDGRTIATVPLVDPSRPPSTPPAVVAASGDLLGAVGGRLQRGRMFDSGHEQRHDRVVVLGAAAAESLGVTSIDARPTLFIGGHAYAVIGILAASETRRSLESSVILPLATARAEFPGVTASTLALGVELGAGALVAHQAPIALAPSLPEVYSVSAPGEPSTFQTGLQGDLDLVFLAIGLITLLAGALGIAGTTLGGVTERTGEIGLRRALGATRGEIAGQFVAESAAVGVLGGLMGSAAGVFVVVGVSAAQGWTPVLDLALAFGAVGVGGLVGLLAGLLPSHRAARIEPAEALRTTAT